MADDRQSLTPFQVLRVFAAAFVLLIGLGIMFKSGFYWDLILGAVFSACGLTFFALLWLYGRR
jgi:hypothetical protein